MKFRIHNRENGDSLVVEGDTIEECREQAKGEGEKRYWKIEDCWSEKLEDEYHAKIQNQK